MDSLSRPGCSFCEHDLPQCLECKEPTLQYLINLNGWNNIEDHGWPKDNFDVLIYTSKKKMFIGRYSEERDGWTFSCPADWYTREEVGLPEYWMPLPEAPKE